MVSFRLNAVLMHLFFGEKNADLWFWFTDGDVLILVEILVIGVVNIGEIEFRYT